MKIKPLWQTSGAVLAVLLSFVFNINANAQTKPEKGQDTFEQFVRYYDQAAVPAKNVSKYNTYYTLTYSEEVYLLARDHGFPQGTMLQAMAQTNEPCVLIPGATQVVQRNRQSVALPNQGENAAADIVCGVEALAAIMQPPTRGPIPPDGVQPDFVVPHKRLFPVNCNEDFWDCDDTAWAYCNLLPESERGNCHIFFIFSYGWAHALVIQRAQKPDGTWEVCLIEPSSGVAIYCYDSEDGSLRIPGNLWDDAASALCSYYKSIGLDCEDWRISLFLRFRYRNPADGWSEWMCGEKPWWQCGDQDAIDEICQELRDAGINPCDISGQCSGCEQHQNPQQPNRQPEPREYPGIRRPGEY